MGEKRQLTRGRSESKVRGPRARFVGKHTHFAVAVLGNSQSFRDEALRKDRPTFIGVPDLSVTVI